MDIPSKPCLECGVVFYKKPTCSRKDWKNRTKYCSRVCSDKHTLLDGSIQPKSEQRAFGERNNKWKGGAIWKKCLICKTRFNLREFSIRQRDKMKCCSRKCSLIYRNSNEFRDRLSKTQRERVPQVFIETRKLRSLLRRCSIYNRWRVEVFKRDNYTCQKCGIRGGKLHADHIEPFIKVMLDNNVKTYEDAVKCKKLWDVGNGQTLCRPCHYKTDTFGSKVHKAIVK